MDDNNEMIAPGIGGRTGPCVSEETERPQFAFEGHEDEVYHEARLPKRGADPDYCAVLDKSWTFNRAMIWPDPGNGTVLCHESGGSLALTGEQRVSDWFSDLVNKIEHQANNLVFEKKSERRREAVVLPGFQINLDQHPELEIIVHGATTEWQVCVVVKGRSGPPLIASDWRKGSGKVILDIAEAWRKKGFTLSFAELHIAFGLWSAEAGSEESCVFEMRMPGQSAVVPCLPVIRTTESSKREGVPLSAVIVDQEGKCPDPAVVNLAARVNGETFSMQARNGVWIGNIKNIDKGEYTAELETTGALSLKNKLHLRVAADNFLSYNAERHSLEQAGRVVGPVTGSYQGFAFARNPGTSDEKQVNGQKAWEEWRAADTEGEHWHYWEALTESEIDERFAYLAKCGWDLLHISQGFGVWEKLDACGHIMPHGAEQLALVMRTAARHGLAVLQALSHYPYSAKHTPALRQYLEAGFKEPDWTQPCNGSRFTELFHGYLRDFAMLFREEPALFAMSTSGEGDIAAGPERVNDTFEFMQKHMPNHIFLAEPIHRLNALPEKYKNEWFVYGWTKQFAEGCRTDVEWKPQLAGSRMYWMGEELHPEIDLGIEFKFLQLDHCFMGEGSWPCHHLYARFMGQQYTWAGTENYRRRVRDSLYVGLIHRCPVMLTWEEQHTEDERIVLREARELIDWSQPFLDAPVAIRVDSPNVGGGESGMDGRRTLAEYEKYFSAIPIMTRYLKSDEPSLSGAGLVVDACRPYQEPVVPEKLLSESPLILSPGYRACYLWSADRRTLLAYIYNCADHESLKYETKLNLSGIWHRKAQPTECSITMKNLPDEHLVCRIYSLDKKRVVSETDSCGGTVNDLGVSSDDYFIFVTPKNRSVKA